MAPLGVRARLARLTERLDDIVIRHQARKAAGDGGSVAEAERELRRFYRLVAVRLGPHADHRALAALVAEEYGVDRAEVYREMQARRAARARRRM